MSKQVALALVVLSACAPEPPSWDPATADKADAPSAGSFGALATATVSPEFAALGDTLSAELSPTTLPHQAKLIRKRIGLVRDYVDLFSYAYPGAADFDPWAELRDELDDGYELVGSFKDLFDAQRVEDPADAVYDHGEVDELRAAVLEWRDAFVVPDRLAFFRHYLTTAASDELYSRDKDDLPRFYWREAKIEPKKSLGGIDNIARLERALLEEAADDLAETATIDELTKGDNDVAFHDFRKRLRSALKLTGYFPTIVEPDEDPSAEKAVLEEVVDLYGDINDALVALHRARERNDDDETEALEDEIEERWDALKDWQHDAGVDDALDGLRRAIRH